MRKNNKDGEQGAAGYAPQVARPQSADVGQTRNNMKTIFPLLTALLLFVCAPIWARELPAWNQVSESPEFFHSNGFSFETDELPEHLYSKTMIELEVLIPDSFTRNGLTNTFYNALLLNDDLGIDIHTWPYEGKERAIINLSTAMAQQSKMYFYFKNTNDTSTEGTQYIVGIRQILESIKNENAQQGGPAYPPQGVGSADP